MQQSFFAKYKVLIVGLLIAVLTAALELLTAAVEPSPWILGWSLAIAIASYLARNLRGQWASIAGIFLSTMLVFFEAHNDPGGLTLKEVGTTLVIPLAIKLLGFAAPPPKDRAYEHSAPITKAKMEAETRKQNR